VTLAQTIIAAATVVVAVVGLRFAKAAAEASRDAARLSGDMLKEAEASREEAARDRQRERIVRVERSLRDAYDAARRPQFSGEWEPWRQALAVSLVGLDADLPICAHLAVSGTSAMLEKMEAARSEVVTTLRQLDAPG
jgi:hypothetical protein